MSKIKRIKHSLIAGLQGIQDGILEVADRVYLTVQKTKLILEISEFEKEVKKNHASIGKLAYQLKTSQDLKSIIEHPETMKLLETCRNFESKLARLRQRYHELNENRLDDQMTSLKQVLEQKNMQIVRLNLSSNSPFKGCTLNEIQLPPNILVLCVLKKNRLIIAKGETRLDEQDNIFVMGLESAIRQITERFQTNPQ